MEENNVPEAAPVTTGTEETSTNSNQAPVPAPAPAPAPAAPSANIPTEQIEAFNKFVAGQGGFDAAFTKWKQLVSAPQTAQQPAQPAQPVQPVQQPAQAQMPQSTEIPEGYLAPTEYAVINYFNDLANEEKYAGIAEDIRNGSIVKEMESFGMQPLRNGLINVKDIRRFFDLKAQAKPAPVPTTPIGNTPTVNYVDVGKSISTIEDARKVLSQNLSLGGGEHPLTQQAKDFVKQYYSKK